MSQSLIILDTIHHKNFGSGEILDRFRDSDGRELMVVKFPHPPGMVHTDRAQIIPVLILPAIVE